MKKLTQLLLITCNLLAGQCLVYGQLGKIALQHNSNLTNFSDLTAALAASANGDTLYLPGGVINPSNPSIIIDKNLVIIGAGHYPDSTVATYQTTVIGTIYIVTGADGGLLTGVRSSAVYFGTGASNQNVNNYRIVRCYLESFYPSYSGQSASQNIFISESVINSCPACGSSYFTSVLFEKNILNFCNYPYTSSYGGSATFNNCNFYHYGTNNMTSYFFTGTNPCQFNNCIIMYFGYIGFALNIGSGYTVFNNLLVSYSQPPQIFYNGIMSNTLPAATTANTFMNSITSGFTYTNNYHLKSTSTGHNAGTDGTDVGIYGTSAPYKASAVPFNPHISSKSVGSSTNPTGTLNVDIKVSAQDR